MNFASDDESTPGLMAPKLLYLTPLLKTLTHWLAAMKIATVTGHWNFQSPVSYISVSTLRISKMEAPLKQIIWE
jgi:hypothetical protein